MNATKQYEALVNARIELETRTAKAQVELDKHTERIVTRKLDYLAKVGKSVLNKKLGADWRDQDLTYLGDVAVWLRAPKSKITAITLEKIEFTNTSLGSQKPRTVFSIDRKLVHMSDRELAKLLRSTIYARKARLKRVELDTAAKSIQTLEAEIASKQKEMVRLQNIVEAEKIQLAKRTTLTKAEASK